MDIKWYGHAAFRIVPEEGPVTITDPYTPEGVGYAPIPDPAELVLISSDDDSAHCRADLVAGDPTVLNALAVAQGGGTARAAGLTVRAIEAAEWDRHPGRAVPGQNGMYRWEMDGLSLAHMGDVGNPLTGAQQDFFADVDILFALAGGPPTIALPDLMATIRRAKPKLVIPMHFRTLTYRPRDTLWIESFLAHFEEEAVDFACAHEVTLGRGDMPETTRVLVMDYAR